MEKSVRLLNDLLPRIDEYLSERKDEENVDLHSFVLWLNHKIFIHEMTDEGPLFAENEALDPFHRNINVQINFLLFQLSRHVKNYLKHVLGKINLAGMDDYHFLLTLMMTKSMTKSELIHENVVEFSSGIEVIKRLLRDGLIEEFDDPDDKRSKRVMITKKGREKVGKSVSEIEKISDLFPGSLESGHRIRLLSLLTQLRDFHKELFAMHKPKGLSAMIDRIHHRG